MLCCLLSALLAGKIAVLGRLARLTRSLIAAMLALAGIAAGGAHAGHYADRAQANGRSLVEEILASPVCGGAVERTTT